MSESIRNLSAVLVGPQDIRVLSGDVPRMSPHDVIIRMQRVGICGSDVHYYLHGQCGPFKCNGPMTIGHESSGVVERVGSCVHHLKQGDRVAIEPGIPCRSCSYCLQGRYNLCPDIKFFATPPTDGSLALYVSHPADFCYLLPDNLTLDEGALCEPLSVGVHACNRAGVKFGSNVLVLGCGPIGLVTIMVAKAYGASRIVATDILEHRLAMARECGATDVISLIDKSDDQSAVSGNFKPNEVVYSEISGAFANKHPEVSIDCTGFENSIQTALDCTAAGGTVCVVGMSQSTVSVPLISAAAREIDIVGVFRYANTYRTCIQLLSSGAVDVKKLITHRFGFSNEDITAGFEMARSGEAVKVMFSLPDRV